MGDGGGGYIPPRWLIHLVWMVLTLDEHAADGG